LTDSEDDQTVKIIYP